MKKLAKLLPLGLAVLGTSAFADPNITMPTPDYTDFYAGVGVVLGVSLVVMLAKRIKHFFR
ncbi:hypothetical protein LNAT_P0652 [Lebetimonas natsushimae]|uniref:Uncharacterized protein n=1 Tax=Lebetimonas natsushimae TaxID=1936991 RepID=A0A292YB83_9BACT|nr:hypothetical protein [Lebetimonas natsushimae]GAX87357.1 hypothetical protein LNAT_P0652 [Lebetimonas natsushimae]